MWWIELSDMTPNRFIETEKIIVYFCPVNETEINRSNE